MRNVLLSADGEISVYSVPNEVAEHLDRYCLEFCSNWLYESPDADKYCIKIGAGFGVCYTEKDFIDYLNQYICEEQSVLVETLSEVYSPNEAPMQYRGLPWFNF